LSALEEAERLEPVGLLRTKVRAPDAKWSRRRGPGHILGRLKRGVTPLAIFRLAEFSRALLALPCEDTFGTDRLDRPTPPEARVAKAVKHAGLPGLG